MDFNIEDWTDDQKFIMQRFASLVRSVLSVMEFVVSPDTEPQRHALLRSKINKEIYRVRNDILFRFTGEVLDNRTAKDKEE